MLISSLSEDGVLGDGAGEPSAPVSYSESEVLSCVMFCLIFYSIFPAQWLVLEQVYQCHSNPSYLLRDD